MKSNSLPRRFSVFVALAFLLTLLPGCDVQSVTKSPAAKSRDDARDAKTRQQNKVASSNNMKRLALGIHGYAGDKKALLPPAYLADNNGKPLLSWRVLILPYMDQDGLYRQFHLDEPWDSQHNKQLLAQMPDVYRAPGSTVADRWKTNYMTVRGADTIFSGKTPCPFSAIRDGTSNTVMTVEVPDAKAVEWTRPDDFEFNPRNPMDGLVGMREGGFWAGAADGATYFVKSPKPADVLNAWFNKSDRKDVPIDE